MSRTKVILDLLTELANDQSVDKAAVIRTVSTVLRSIEDTDAEEPVEEEKKLTKKRQKASKRMLDGKEVIAVLEKAPPDGWTEKQIYEEGMNMGMPWPTTEETGLRYLSRRLSKDTKVYRMLANDRWILRRKIVPLKESAE